MKRCYAPTAGAAGSGREKGTGGLPPPSYRPRVWAPKSQRLGELAAVEDQRGQRAGVDETRVQIVVFQDLLV